MPENNGWIEKLSILMAHRFRSAFRLISCISIIAISWISTPTCLRTSSITSSSLSFSLDTYSRLSLLKFLFASFIGVLREPSVFWSISKIFSLIYSFALALNVLQWCLKDSAFQLLLKNISFNTIQGTQSVGYLLLHQPYTTFFLYLLLEFLVYCQNRPKNWSLPPNQKPVIMATFDHGDTNDIVIRLTAHPTNKSSNEVQYREAIRRTVSNLYKLPIANYDEKLSNAVLLRNNTPPRTTCEAFHTRTSGRSQNACSTTDGSIFETI